MMYLKGIIISMNRIVKIYWVLLITFMLFACKQPMETVIRKEANTDFPEKTSPAINSPNPVAYASPESSTTPTIINTLHIQGFQKPTIEITQIPTELPITMCSPLKDETLASLWEIVTNPFGAPPIGREDLHHGVDFAHYRRGEQLSIDGEIIQSLFPGIVAASIVDRLPYGNMVIVETPYALIPEKIMEKFGVAPGESLYSLYAHMGNLPRVNLNDDILCGQSLGIVGITGYDIVNPHLHLETRIGPPGIRFLGMAFYDASATEEEMNNYKRWRTSGDFRNIDPMMIIVEYLSSQNPGFQTPTP
jgi:murein DD-endopeptidase MepM/ murein hydrolase activator NlpD